MYPMPSLYTMLAHHGTIGRSLLDCDEYQTPLYMSVCVLERISIGPRTVGFSEVNNVEKEWDESKAHHYDFDGKLKDGVPHRFIDPISKVIMVDPVIAPDSQTYDFSSLKKLANNSLPTGMISPMTMQWMDPTLKVYNNVVLREMIYDFVEHNGGMQRCVSPETTQHASIQSVRSVNVLDSGPLISHYAVTRTFMRFGNFPVSYEAYTVELHIASTYEYFFIKTFGYGDIPSKSYRIDFKSTSSYISSMQWFERTSVDPYKLYITVSSPDLRDGGLYIYSSAGLLEKRLESTFTKSLGAIFDHGNLTKVILHRKEYLHNKSDTLEMLSLDGKSHTTSYVNEDIQSIGFVNNVVVALLQSGRIVKFDILYGHTYHDISTTAQDLVPLTSSPHFRTCIGFGHEMFVVMMQKVEGGEISVSVYNHMGTKRYDSIITTLTDISMEGMAIVRDNGRDSTGLFAYSILFTASQSLHKIQLSLLSN
jgi:hypothetical protein